MFRKADRDTFWGIIDYTESDNTDMSPMMAVSVDCGETRSEV